MFIDSHCHIFTVRIVENVSAKREMLDRLKLNTNGALDRLDPLALQESAETNNVDVCVLLPTASPDKVPSENDRFIQISNGHSRLRTFATLHPDMEDLSGEVERMFDLGIHGFKFSSFSQRFDLVSRSSMHMFSTVERLGGIRGIRPTLIFDTFATADRHFGADPDHLTTPAKLSRVAARHEGINVIGAHMGSLLGDFDTLRRDLPPGPNIYLDTANAAHTFPEDQFVELLRMHGASRILFGTDWPWFQHAAERSKIGDLLDKAGYDQSDKEAVFGRNAERLLKLG